MYVKLSLHYTHSKRVKKQNSIRPKEIERNIEGEREEEREREERDRETQNERQDRKSVV